MTDERRRITRVKKLARLSYGIALGASAVITAPFSGRRGAPRVYYGGALVGDVGGPLVKVRRLIEYFPEHQIDYNLVYALSNAPYLPDFALALLRLRGIPIVHNQNGLFYPAWYRGDWRGENARMARTYRQAAHVFWQSEFCRRGADLFLGPREGPGEVLYNAVDTSRFTPAPAIPDGPVVFLMTGKMDAHLYYRIENAIRGFANVVAGGLDARLRLAGWAAPTVEERARSLAEALGIADRLEFKGRYTQAIAPDIYRAAHIYISTKHNDACPNAVIEAMACGLPVVFSASGGVPELVGDAGIGVKVPESWDEPQVPDEIVLAQAMHDVAADRGRFGAAARERAAAHFDIGHWIARHRTVFESLTR
ncbi:MAG: glycosyltransferase family 4 protein [Rhodospirillales bacterium]|nr:glycosyltransferase family 4 protein [Rhodospirillales bacterium]